MKLLVRYGRVGPARFASHRDFARAFERALRRADIPMAYSSGFNPHPRVSYVNPAPTGAASEAEYLVIALREPCDPADVRTRLARVMPAGFPMLEVQAVPMGRGGTIETMGTVLFVSRNETKRTVPIVSPPAGSRRQVPFPPFEASLWEVRWPGADVDSLRAAVRQVDPGETACGSAPAPVLVTRQTKNGLRTFDVRVPLESIAVDDAGVMRMVIRHTEPLVRPDDVCTGLRQVGTGLPDVPPLTKRLWQGGVDEVAGR